MDNIYYAFKCPARVGNERNLTDYHTRVVLDDYYRAVLKTTDEHDYRRKLQKSGENIIDGSLQYLVENAQCRCNNKPCVLPKK
jgi:hypothetical protein